MAMAESKVGHAAVADRTGIANDTGPAVGLQGCVRAVEGRDDGPRGARAVIRGQQDLRRARVLQLDEVRLVLDDEGFAEPFGQRVIRRADLNSKLADRWMVRKRLPRSAWCSVLTVRRLRTPSTRSARPPLVPCNASQWPPASSQRSMALVCRALGRGRRHR